jgi:hypothetical protein
MDPVLAQIRKLPCFVCYKPGPSDPSHIRSRGAVGNVNTNWNVVAMCRKCHIEWHQMGRITFLNKHPVFFNLLKTMGWEVVGGKLTHEKFLTSG